MASRAVPLARRQLFAEPARLAVAVLAVGAAVALVLLLTGLRRGMGEQVTVYLEHQPPVLVGQEGARDFLSETSVLPEATATRVAAVDGVARVDAISEGYAMLQLHGKRVLAVLIGYDRRGGPWSLVEGRAPRDGELVLDRVLAEEHGLDLGATIRFRGTGLRVVGLSEGTSGFMTPLAFTTRATANRLDERPGTATFLLVTPEASISPALLDARIERAVPSVSVERRDDVARRDRELFVGSFSAPLRAMTAIAVAVAVLVIALTVYLATRDRWREYATLKALGLARGALLRLVALQSTSIALAGTALGLVLAVAVANRVDAVAPKYLIALTASDALAMGAAALAFALLAGVVPARFLAGLDPATAFRR